MTVALSTTTLRHRVRLVHVSTGRPLAPVRATLVPTPPGWVARSTGDGVVVTAREGLPTPSPLPALAVTLEPATWGELLEFPPAPDQPPRTVVVPLDAEEIDVPLHPVAMTLVVHLAEPRTGKPREGRRVIARATSGPDPLPTVALHEGEPGVYASAAVEWTASFTPFELLVDDTPLRTSSVSFTSSTTRVRLVDTT